MKSQQVIFAKPLNPGGLEARFKTAVSHVVGFFTDSCCIDCPSHHFPVEIKAMINQESVSRFLFLWEDKYGNTDDAPAHPVRRGLER